MRSFLARLIIIGAAVALAAAFHGAASQAAGGLKIEPFVWQLNQDYPDGTPPDSSLPIDTVYIKTHDGTDWMSTYDSHPWAVSGPAAIQNLINVYASQGIEVAAWFVPARADYDTQVAMAEQVIDSGVTALYADVEPFSGFCDEDCATLATNVWSRIRQDRPNARLGVIYDPRPWWWDSSATKQWLANADVALPMCYWDDFAGMTPWGDPGGCIAQAKADLTTLAPGKALEYLPILEGDSSAIKVQEGLDAAARADAQRASIWRRGVVSQDVWNMIAGYTEPGGPHCAEQLVDGCLIREAMEPTVFLVEGGAKFAFPSSDAFNEMGLSGRDVQVVPFESTRALPDIPADGTLLTEFGDPTVYIVYGGARFPITGDEMAQLGLDPGRVRTIPTGTLAQIPLVPKDYSVFQGASAPNRFVVIHGARIELDEAGRAALALSGHGDGPVYLVPEVALAQMPLAEVKRGDADCDGTVGALDVVRVLQASIGIPTSGLCVHVSGDVSCDGYALSGDALMILRYIADTPMEPPADCPPIGEPQPASLPQAVPTTAAPAQSTLDATDGQRATAAADSPSATLTPSETPSVIASTSPTGSDSESPMPAQTELASP